MTIIDHFSRRVGSENDRYHTHRVDNIGDMAIDHFVALSGMPLDYYGCDATYHTFKVDNIVFKVLEDPDDGYRSCLGAIDYTEEDKNSIFYKQPISKVKISPWSIGDHDEEDYPVTFGYKIVEEDTGHCWLEFGTQYHDSYYPMFYFQYYPKTSD